MKQKIINKYMRQIKRIYRGNRKDKKLFTEELQDALLCFCEEHPDSSYSDLVQEFGMPSECKELLSFHSAEKLQKRNMFLYWTVNITVIIAAVIVISYTVHYILDRYDYAQGYDVEYFDDDVNGNINPLTRETDPPLDNYIEFD